MCKVCWHILFKVAWRQTSIENSFKEPVAKSLKLLTVKVLLNRFMILSSLVEFFMILSFSGMKYQYFIGSILF